MLRNFFNSRARSFRYAYAGWVYALRTQPNTWVHVVISLLVIILCAWLELPNRDWAIVLVTISLMWAAELFNTAIEAAINLVSPDPHPLAKAGKDAAAGAVLVVAIGAVLIGLLILGPPLWEKLQSIFP